MLKNIHQSYTVFCLKDYRPVTLTSTVLWKAGNGTNKKDHQCDSGPSPVCVQEGSLYSHSATPHPHSPGEKPLIHQAAFLDFSSAFNAIIPQTLVNKLSLLGLISMLCNRIFDKGPRLSKSTTSPPPPPPRAPIPLRGAAWPPPPPFTHY